MTFGERAKAARKAMGLSQKEVAARLGVCDSWISQYERHIRDPKIETVRRIADAIGCPVSDLLGFTHSIELAEYRNELKKLRRAAYDLAAGIDALIAQLADGDE